MNNESIEFDIKVNGKPAEDSIGDVEKAQDELDNTVKKTSKNIKTNWVAVGAAAAAMAATMAILAKRSMELEDAMFGLNEQNKQWIRQASERYAVDQTMIAGFVQMGKASGLSGEQIETMTEQAFAMSKQFANINFDGAVEDLTEFYSAGTLTGVALEYMEKTTGDADIATRSLSEQMDALKESTQGVYDEWAKTDAAKVAQEMQKLDNISVELGKAFFRLTGETGLLNKAVWVSQKAFLGLELAFNGWMQIWYAGKSLIGEGSAETEAKLDSLAAKALEIRTLLGTPVEDVNLTLPGRTPIQRGGGSSTEAAEAKALADEKLRINEQFLDDYNRSTQDAYTYELGLLNAQYEEYDKHVKDKAALNEWYTAESMRLFEELDTQMQAYYQMGEALTQGLTDGIIEFTETGKLNFKDMANSIIQDMLKIQIQQSMMSLFGSFNSSGGGLLGGLFSSIMPNAQGNAFNNGQVTPFASGGVVSSPTLFPMSSGMGLMGEAGAEAIVPLTRTSGGDLGVKSTAPIVNVNVENYGNDNVQVNQDGDNIQVIISQIASSIQRGTGDVGKAIENRYGIRKA